jgi:hypothetical protein
MNLPQDQGCMDGYSSPQVGGGTLPFDPFDDIASRYHPTNMREVWRLCEYFYLTNQTYRKGSERMVDYFLTEPKVIGELTDAAKSFLEKMKEEGRIMDQLRQVGINYMCYTNAVVSVVLPFSRNLLCKKCGSAISMEKITQETVAWDKGTNLIKIPCAKCKNADGLEMKDLPIRDMTNLNLRVWDPKRIHMERNSVTNQKRFWYDIPAWERNLISEGNLFLLRTMPMSILDAVRTKKKLLLSNRLTFHMCDAEISGVDLGGWSPPVIMSAFRNFFRLMVLNRHDEALAADYIVPMRMLSPAPQTGDGNTFMMQNMAEVMANMGDLVRQHQVNGLDWYFTPIPMVYQPIGGEGRSLAPKELIEAEEDRLLNARGIPPEFYRSTMSLQAAPVALRLFEQSNAPLAGGLSRLLTKISDIVSSYIQQGDHLLELESVKILDDLDKTQWRMHAFSAGLISKETAMAPHAIDPAEERDKILAEQEEEMVASMEAEKRMQARQTSLVQSEEEAQQQQADGQGSAGATPGDIQAEARQIAEQLYHPSVDQVTRTRELRNIKSQNELLHSAVIQEGKKLKQEGAAIAQPQGVEQAIEQRQGG